MKNNFIVIGGPISVGKSTIVNGLNYHIVPEISSNDQLQNLILKYTYEKKRTLPEAIEFYFLEKRKENYVINSKLKKTCILDRSIFESLWFAKENMIKKSFVNFSKLWFKEIEELIIVCGKPKLYVLLTMNWETFKKRFFGRGRDIEVKNFNQNKKFFKKHVKEYEKFMKKIFIKFDLNFIKIDTNNLTSQKVLALVKKAIAKVIDE